MARLLEVAGETQDGSVTLVATVLSEGADENDPLSEAARSLLDGHIVLSAALAHAGRFPAIDVLSSASRTMANVSCATHLAGARAVRSALARLAQTADARSRDSTMWPSSSERAESATGSDRSSPSTSTV